jgi:hypothetical protein
MAVQRRKPQNNKYKQRGSRYKARSRFVSRPRGSFGLVRSTRFTPLRLAARRFRQQLNPFPNSKLVRHKYVDTITLTPPLVAGRPQVYIFATNSMWDPDRTSTGHQAMFNDEMQAQYQYYTILRSKIKVSFPPTDSNQTNYCLWVDDDTTYPTFSSAAGEQHVIRHAIRLDKRNGPLVMYGSYDAAKWNKTSRAGILADDLQKVAEGLDPRTTVMKYFMIYRAPMDTSVTLPQI